MSQKKYRCQIGDSCEELKHSRNCLALKLGFHERPQLGGALILIFLPCHAATGGVDQNAGEAVFLAGRGGVARGSRSRGAVRTISG